MAYSRLHEILWHGFVACHLIPKDIPFVAKGETFKEMLDRAPVKTIGLFKGVYNKETDEIEHAEFIEADSLDNETRNLIDSDPLVVLS